MPERPRRLGPFDVVVKIAGGGMATIYLGRRRDAQGATQLAAIKVIRHDLRQDPRFVEMFHDEAHLLSRLSHPNITQTLEYGWENEQHFIAMELMVGRNLGDVWDACKERKLTLRFDHAAWIGARVADALHHAHELTGDGGSPLGLVHRDVNPSNVFLTFDGEVKLFDFGLAKSTEERRADSGMVKGKLAYLAPEQLLDMDVDRRSDIYMLGTTLWEATTMRRLFKRDDGVETLMAVRAGLVPDPRATVPDYPEDLWAILHRALARSRDDRYATASEFAHDLDAYVARQGTAEGMAERTGGILDALFPGEREKRALWLRGINAQRHSIPPPSPGARTTPTPPAQTWSSPPPSVEPPALAATSAPLPRAASTAPKVGNGQGG